MFADLHFNVNCIKLCGKHLKNKFQKDILQTVKEKIHLTTQHDSTRHTISVFQKNC